MREYVGDATAVPDLPPRKPQKDDEREEIDYLICRQCNSPCYVFELDKGRIKEAVCEMCGNDDILFFSLAEEEHE